MTPITDPTALFDQENAASRELADAMSAARAAGAGTLSIAPAGAWLTARLAQLRDSVTDGTALACPHLAGGPRIVVTALWLPGVLACAHCAPQLRPTEDEDHTCDRCRRQVPTIHPRAASHGPLLIVYGLCHHCRHAEETTDRKAAHRPTRPARKRRSRR